MPEWLFSRHGRREVFLCADRFIGKNGRNMGWLVNNNVYSLRGKHIGWFENGVLYDGRSKTLAVARGASGACPFLACTGGDDWIPPVPDRPDFPELERAHYKPTQGEGWSVQDVLKFFSSDVKEDEKQEHALHR